MVTNEDFAEGMNNLFEECRKLNPLKKLWLRIRFARKDTFTKMTQRPIQKIVDIAPLYFIEKNKEKLDELAKGCTFKEMEVFGRKQSVMVKSTPEYQKFYNTEVVDAAIKFLKTCEITKAVWKKHKKVIELHLERPGVFIGYHSETLNFFQNALGLKIKIKEDKWGINSVIESLHYMRCVNELEDLL